MDLNDVNNRVAIGIPFETSVKLTRPVVKDRAGIAQVNSKTFTDYIQLSYRDSGPFMVELEDKRFGRVIEYPIRSDSGSDLGTEETLTETGTRQVMVRGRSEDVDISIINTSHLNSRLAGVTQMVTAVPT